MSNEAYGLILTKHEIVLLLECLWISSEAEGYKTEEQVASLTGYLGAFIGEGPEDD